MCTRVGRLEMTFGKRRVRSRSIRGGKAALAALSCICLQRLLESARGTREHGAMSDRRITPDDQSASPRAEDGPPAPMPHQHSYRLPEIADAMRQTVSYGGCAVSPMATPYQRIEIDGDSTATVDTENKVLPHNSMSRPIGGERSGLVSMSSSSRLFQGSDAFSTKTGRPHTLILRFDTTGVGTFQQMSRLDVLRLAQEAAKPKKVADDDDDDTHTTNSTDESRDELIRPPSRVRSHRRGSHRHSDPRVGGDFFKAIQVQRVHARDIRKLDHAFAVSNEPSIVVRNQAILMNADPLRAVITRDVCLVFVPDGADSLLTTLKTKFHEHNQPPHPMSDGLGAVSTVGAELPLPFEMRALEALLATICRTFEHEFEKTAPVVTSTLDRLAHGRTITTGELETLRGFKNTINEFESQVDGIRRALMEILDSEEDLRLLHLTKLFEEPDLLKDLYSFDSEDVEVMIETYLQDIFSTRTKASLLQHRIQNTESLVMLKLDSIRNDLLGVELCFSLVAISISIGTYVTGVFGMNLNSHLQERDWWFWGVVIFTVVVFIIFTASGIVYFRRKGVHI